MRSPPLSTGRAPSLRTNSSGLSRSWTLELPPNSRIHDVFHVSQLKPFTPNYTPVFAELPKPPDLTAGDIEPVEILERKRGNSALAQLHIRWSSSTTATTWEDYDTMRRRFPSAIIWQDDKAEPTEAAPDEAAPEEEALSEDEGSVTPTPP